MPMFENGESRIRQMRLPVEMDRRLVIIAREQGMSVSALIRKCLIDAFFSPPNGN